MATIAFGAASFCSLKASSLVSCKVNVSRTFVQGGLINLRSFEERRPGVQRRLQAGQVRAEQEVEQKAAPSRALTGYVTKDTAGQENIYAVEPTIYVGDSAISTNSGGTSSDGSGGTLIISGFLAVAAISGASAVLLSVGSSQSSSVEEAYKGPPLSYYVLKFKEPDSVPSSFLDASQIAPEVSAVVDDVPVAVESLKNEVLTILEIVTDEASPVVEDVVPEAEESSSSLTLAEAEEST